MACKINVKLSNGLEMPALGYGTWQAKDEEFEKALDSALIAGYRHIDTAWAYENEHVIGKVLKRWLESGKLKRDDLFIVTKLPLYGNRPEEVEQYLKGSLEKLQLSYVDVYLVHCPIGYFKIGNNITDWKLDPSTDLVAIWRAMEKQVQAGRTRSIGVSNFNIKQVERILANAKIPPVTNQVEFHAYLQQPELINYLKSNNIAVTAYSPLGTPGAQAFFQKNGIKVEIPILMEDATVKEVAKKYNKSAAQILLRHIIQKGMIAIPKSTNPARLRSNIEIFDFELSEADMKAIDGLDRNARIVNFAKAFPGCDKHPEYPF